MNCCRQFIRRVWQLRILWPVGHIRQPVNAGDFIGYDWNGSGGGSMSGSTTPSSIATAWLIAMHFHLGVNWTLGGAADYFFIHITLPDSIVPTRRARFAGSEYVCF